MKTLVSRELVVNKSNLAEFRLAVLYKTPYASLADQLDTRFHLNYTVEHISRVLNGSHRPSYHLAVALMYFANQHIRSAQRSKTKTELDSITERYTLRSLPFAHYEDTTPEYFESTPRRIGFRVYNTDALALSMTGIAAEMNISERTLQHYTRGTRVPSKDFLKTAVHFSSAGRNKLVTNSDVLSFIRKESEQAARLQD